VAAQVVAAVKAEAVEPRVAHPSRFSSSTPTCRSTAASSKQETAARVAQEARVAKAARELPAHLAAMAQDQAVTELPVHPVQLAAAVGVAAVVQVATPTPSSMTRPPVCNGHRPQNCDTVQVELVEAQVVLMETLERLDLAGNA
jgi:hypothetical protein